LQSNHSSTPNFKACGPDGIPMEFFKALIPCKDDSEGSSDNNSNISSGFKCLKALINRIWNGDFPKSWNNASIVSIHKKGMYKSLYYIKNYMSEKEIRK